MKKAAILSGVLFVVSLFSIPVFGQSSATSTEGENAPAQADIGPLTYGGSSSTSYVVSMFECVTSTSHEWVPNVPDTYLTADGHFSCPLHLPNGASIVAIEIEACDNSASGEAQLQLARTTQVAGGGSTIAQAASGVAATPGCDLFPFTLIAPVTVDNANSKYYLRMYNTVFDGSVYLAGARVYYKLQVSPAPATATFADVPTTHPFFRFVEALAASGITGGCAGGNFCPNNPVTRGQMAVFLSAALGLHWPN